MTSLKITNFSYNGIPHTNTPSVHFSLSFLYIPPYPYLSNDHHLHFILRKRTTTTTSTSEKKIPSSSSASSSPSWSPSSRKPINQQASLIASSFKVTKINTMEFTLIVVAIITTIGGTLSFLLGVAAEVKRLPPSGPQQLKNGKVICHYPEDNSSHFAYASLILIVLSAIVGSLHKYHTTHGIKIPVSAYKHNTMLKVFFVWAMFMEALGFYMIFQPLYVMNQLRNQTTYTHPIEACPTADSGVVAGGALSSFGACILWIPVYILAKNCREDFLRGNDGTSSVGSYGLIEEELDGPW